MPNEKILTFGSSRLSLSLLVSQQSGGSFRIGDGYETTLGGRGETTAIAIARLGGKSVFCGRCGDDSGGKRLVRLLDASGVDLSCFHVDKSQQTGFLVTTTVAGQVSDRLLFPGADDIFLPEEVREAFLSSPDAVCLSGELPVRMQQYVGELSAQRGIPLFYNYTATAVLPEALPTLEVFSTDEASTVKLTGIRPAGAESCLQAVIEMQKQVKATYYVIRLGERGAFVYNGTYCHMVNSYIVKQVDLRGADDVFFGAMVLEYLRVGRDILPACAYAAAAAALTVSRVGEAASVPDADEVLSFLEKN